MNCHIFSAFCWTNYFAENSCFLPNQVSDRCAPSSDFHKVVASSKQSAEKTQKMLCWFKHLYMFLKGGSVGVRHPSYWKRLKQFQCRMMRIFFPSRRYFQNLKEKPENNPEVHLNNYTGSKWFLLVPLRQILIKKNILDTLC